MKSIISLLLCSLLIGSITSQAAEITQKSIPTQDQETQPEQNVRPYGRAFMSTTDVICNNSKVIYNLLKSEPGPQVPIFFGLIKNSQGDVIMVAQIFIYDALLDKENHRFSIVESSAQGISCIISAGSNFDILPHSHEHEGRFLKGNIQKIKRQN